MSSDHEEPYLWHKPEVYPPRAPFFFNLDEDLGDMTLIDALQRSAEQFPKRKYLFFSGMTMTYGQVWSQVQAFASELTSLGVSSEDTVAILMPNIPQFVVAFFTAHYIGCKTTLCNPLHVSSELRFHLNDSGSTVLLTADFLYDNVYPIRPETNLRLVVATNIGDVLPAVKGFLGKKLGKIPVGTTKDLSVFKWKDILKEGMAKTPVLPAKPDIHDIAVLQYTGGTTGSPKAAMLSHRNLLVNALGVYYWTPEPIDETDVFMGALPFFHVFGLTVALIAATTRGSGLVCAPNPRDIKAVLSEIQGQKVTYFPSVPTLFIAILNHPEVGNYDLSSLKFCISGAAPLAQEVRKQFEEKTKAVVLEGYGMSESSPVTVVNPPHRIKDGSIGVPFPSTNVRVVDLQTREPVEVGTVGELVVAGPQVMKGYWDKAEETDNTLEERDGQIWLHTGDVAKMDEEGYFYIVDRAKDMIIVSGFKVFPREVEDVLFEHPAVKNVAVVGVPDERTIERVRAFIELKEGVEPPTIQEIQEFAKDKLGKYKVPKEIEFRQSLPTSMVGKVLRRELRGEMATDDIQPQE